MTRVLNSGSDAPIQIEQLGYDLKDARDLARMVARTLQDTPGVADPLISREENYPQFDIVVDREKAAMAGLSQRDIAQTALISPRFISVFHSRPTPRPCPHAISTDRCVPFEKRLKLTRLDYRDDIMAINHLAQEARLRGIDFAPYRRELQRLSDPRSAERVGLR